MTVWEGLAVTIIALCGAGMLICLLLMVDAAAFYARERRRDRAAEAIAHLDFEPDREVFS